MTHRDEGHYAEKHVAHEQPDQAIANAIRKRSAGGKLSCAAAFRIAEEVGIEPSEVGRALDLLEIKIMQCQLGLFGHERGRRLIAKSAGAVPAELERVLRAGLVNGRLPCATAWEVAERFDFPKMGITSACEKLNIRIGQCQLGSF